jgi:hypothetical protein
MNLPCAIFTPSHLRSVHVYNLYVFFYTYAQGNRVVFTSCLCYNN